jgi:branched-chain amino acid transport system substrate-binding protein
MRPSNLNEEPPRWSSLARRAVGWLAGPAACLLSSGCVLTNIGHDDCSGDDQCAAAFGLGSQCQKGFCTAPQACKTGHDCREALGGGVCVEGRCSATFPEDPDCGRVEPPDLLSRPAIGEDAPLVIGGMFALDDAKNSARADSARLAVRDINRSGGMADGRELGIIVCDNGGPENGLLDEERVALNEKDLGYLAGTLGVPLLVGPSSSSDAITLVNALVKDELPTVIISPSATSPELTAIEDRLEPKDPYGLFWRTCPSDRLQGKALAIDVDDFGDLIHHVAVVYIQDPYGEGLSQEFIASYGVERTTSFPFTPDDIASEASLEKLAKDIDATEELDGIVLIAVQASDTVAILKHLADKPASTAFLFLTDGSKDATVLLDPKLPKAVRDMIVFSFGTAPAAPEGQNFQLFADNLDHAFGVDASAFSFLAHTYDATFAGAAGLLYASRNGPRYDGKDVANGLALLVSGPKVAVRPTEWNSAKTSLLRGNAVNLDGTSGRLDFDAKTGEGPGAIAYWGVSSDGKSFTDFGTIDVD